LVHSGDATRSPIIVVTMTTTSESKTIELRALSS
jgi:hypothetical protein